MGAKKSDWTLPPERAVFEKHLHQTRSLLSRSHLALRSILAVLLLFAATAAQAGVLARFKMNEHLGTIDVELFEQDKPVTVSNFVAYVKSGAWHDTLMHRWLPNQLLQGGFYHLPHDPTLMTSWEATPSEVVPFPTIPFEKDVGRFFSNVFGTLGMARVGTDTNSASTSWFFNLRDNPAFDTTDGGYTVFGRTVRGTSTLQRFVPVSGTDKIFWVFGTEVPVYEGVDINYLLNVDITLLTANIALVAEGVQISWNSVEGLPNIVEFKGATSTAWQTLQTVAGNGGTMSVNDGAVNFSLQSAGIARRPAPETMRQYRIRIEYPN